MLFFIILSLTALGHIMFWLCALLFFRGQGWVWVNDDKAVTHLLSGPVVFSIPDHPIQTQECDESLQTWERETKTRSIPHQHPLCSHKNTSWKDYFEEISSHRCQKKLRAQVFVERVETKHSTILMLWKAQSEDKKCGNSPNTRATKSHREFASWKTSLVRI